ncbi:MAG: SulP family inorganic anion transporter [Anaeromyxobacteraceae bacterium]
MDGRRIAPELGAGLAAALMALPMAIGNGILAYSTLGPEHAAAGAVAGLVGAILLGAMASILGGTPGLVSAPSGPAAAMLTAHAAWLAAVAPERAHLLLLATGFVAGLVQLGFGALRLGTVVKFIPYPVVSGFLSAAGILLAWGQLPSVTGVAAGGPLGALTHPGAWRAVSLVVAGATFAAMRVAPRLAPRLPPVVAGLGAGSLTWFAFQLSDPALAAVAGNPLRVGSVPGVGAIAAAIPALVQELSGLRLDDLQLVAGPAAALAALLSVDTLKSCVLVDSMTGARHLPSRELVAQGLGNALASLGGGMVGSGASGPTLVNVAAGGRRTASATVPGALLALVALAPALVAGMPRAVLGGILVHVGLRTLDWGTLRLLRRPGHRLEFAVVAAVVAIALWRGLVVAAGAGIALVIVLFLRDRMGQSPVRARGDLARTRSTRRRLPPEDQVLTAHGPEAAVVTLQGDLFFGTADRLLTELGPDLARCRFVLLDLARVSDVDLTAARILAQAQARLAGRGARLLLAGSRAPDELEAALADVSVDPGAPPPRLFTSRDEALEWMEEQLLELHLDERVVHRRLELSETDLLAGLPPASLAAIERRVRTVAVPAGQPVFRAGDPGDALYMVRLGRVRVAVPAAGGRELMIGAFGRGDVFGELAFVDARPRSANATATVDTEVFVLDRTGFEAALEDEPALGAELPARIARVISYRLRVTTGELKAAGE